MAAQAVGDGKVACLVRRRVGKGIQGACAPMAELALREQRRGGLDRANRHFAVSDAFAARGRGFVDSWGVPLARIFSIYC